MINIILLILILIFLIITNIHRIYYSSNIEKHANTNSLYAHYSKIDKYNLIIFPNLIYSHPQHIILQQGQSIYIPKNGGIG